MIPHVLAFVLLFSAAGTPAQTLSDSEKVALVFPFKVGQEYEFMAGDTCYYCTSTYYSSRTKLPPYTVATITITDTIVDGKQYLRIPFWSLASEHLAHYYRLDDSLRIWVGRTDGQTGPWYERLVMDLNDQWATWGKRSFCPKDFYMYNPRAVCWCSAHHVDEGSRPWGWTTREGHPVFRMMGFPAWDDMYPARWVGEQYFGAYGPGSSLHAAGKTSAERSLGGYTFGGYLGLFRPRSGDPWPEFRRVGEATAVVKEEPRRQRPESVSLIGYPNPFNATVTLRYAVPVEGFVTLRIYNLTGQLVRTVMERHLTAGRYTVIWDGADDVGRQMGSGPYLARLVIADRSTTTRVTLVR